MRSVELFAGAGGLGMGLGEAGFEPEMVVEWDADSCRTLRDNKKRGVQHIKGWNIVESDASTVDYSNIKHKIDLVSGGPPCQPFSIGGKHRGQADHRNMWPQAIRAVRELAPQVFLFENVSGLMRPAFKPYLRYIELQLSFPEISPKTGEKWHEHAARLERKLTNESGGRCGLLYHVSIHPVNAADYGAAQKRRRVIIVGFRNDLPVEWAMPAPTHSQESLLWDQWITGDYWKRHGVGARARPSMPPTVRAAIERLRSINKPPAASPWRTVRDAIGDLPMPHKTRERIANHRLQPGARSYVGHTGSPFDEPAKALKAGDHGVPGGENMLAFENGDVRYFTVREAARLQGFPDKFVFPASVSWTESMRQLGNAVPLPLAAAFGNWISSALTAAKKARRAA
jgi:DNA (cytosine-5)-methyltransferase 1